jgi:hypothetical protein
MTTPSGTPDATWPEPTDEEIDEMTQHQAMIGLPGIQNALQRVEGILDGGAGRAARSDTAEYHDGYTIGLRVYTARNAIPSRAAAAPVVGEVSMHPDGYQVEVVGEDEGCFFWYRVEEGTLTRVGKLLAGRWRSGRQTSANEDLDLLRLVQRNAARREKIVAELSRLREEMEALSDRDFAIVQHLAGKHRKAHAA